MPSRQHPIAHSFATPRFIKLAYFYLNTIMRPQYESLRTANYLVFYTQSTLMSTENHEIANYVDCSTAKIIFCCRLASLKFALSRKSRMMIDVSFEIVSFVAQNRNLCRECTCPRSIFVLRFDIFSIIFTVHVPKCKISRT